MLLFISSHSDYRMFLRSHFNHLSSSDKFRLKNDIDLKSAFWKLKRLDTDLVHDLLLSQYSQLYGRPANDPTLTLRSFILMKLLGYNSILDWCNAVASDKLLQYLIGSFHVPGCSCHYDFINRFMHDDPNRSTLFPKGKNTTEGKKKLKKNEKWVNFSEDKCQDLCDTYWDNAHASDSRMSYTIERLFNDIAVVPSQDFGLIDSSMPVCGDGSCLHIHANSNGHRVIDSDDTDACTHRYSAPDADIGWDSDLEKYYFGYTIYNLSIHNPRAKIDLPVHLVLTYASTHDAVTTIPAVANMLDINPNLRSNQMCFDSAMDSIDIYKFLRHRNIVPIIDWNKRRSGTAVNPYAQYEGFNEKGIPVCAGGFEMYRDGYDQSKMATKYRCPLKKGKISSCPFADTCSTSPYGRVKKVYDKTNFKLFSKIMYGTDEWKNTYKNRTCTERINNRLLNDYGLHQHHMANISKNIFMLHIAGICIHLDAWYKVSDDPNK